MRRLLMDTGVAQAFINNQLAVRDRIDAERQQGVRIGICVPVLGELWSGVEGSQARQRNEQRLRAGLSRLVVWPYSSAAAEQFGRLFAKLRRLGRPMQQVDIQIAEIAFTLGDCTVVSTDSDLAAIPGLSVEIWK